MTHEHSSDPRSGHRVSRRTVAAGLAWTAPVVAIAAAAPSMASSGAIPTVVPGGTCKLPGGSCPNLKDYLFQLLITNSDTQAVYLYTGGVYPTYGPSVTINPPNYTLTYAGASVGATTYAPGQPILLPAGATTTVLLDAGINSNSANLAGYVVTVMFQWGHTSDPTLDTDHVNNPVIAVINVDATPPCANCTI